MRGTKEKTTSSSVGLNTAEVLQSRREHGENMLSRQKRKSFLRQFFSNLNDPVIRILLAALGVHLLLLFGNGDLAETIGIGIAVFLATFISTLSEYGSARAFERLEQDAGKILCRVRRDGSVKEIPIREVVVGDVVLLSAGDAIPADGRMLLGALSADQSAMTGESREVRKYPMDDAQMTPESPSSLFRGCTVTEGGGEMLITAVGDATFLGEISREIQTETRESPLKRRLTKLAKQISIFGYIAAALVAAAYLFNTFVISSGWQRELIYIKLTDLPYLLSNLLHAFTLAVSVLVTCVPEGLPMMVAVVLAANIKRMARDRVLVRKPVGIESAGSMNILFTDKTGTLTEGKMTVMLAVAAPGVDPARLARVAYALESRSGHPIAKAITEYFEGTPDVEPDGFSTLPGKGLYGKIDRMHCFAGNEALLFGDMEIELDPLSKETEQILSVGATPVYFSMGEELLGVVGVGDRIRADASDALCDLRALGVRTVMLTGDHLRPAERVARELGCDEIHAGLLPSQKADEVRRLISHHRVAMIGDGINDAEALASSDVGIAIGAGTDVAIASADVVLRRSRMADAVTALRLGRATLKNVKENLFWALVYNAVCIPIAAGALSPLGVTLLPWMAALAMSLSSLFVVSNALRLRRFR